MFRFHTKSSFSDESAGHSYLLPLLGISLDPGTLSGTCLLRDVRAGILATILSGDLEIARHEDSGYLAEISIINNGTEIYGE